MWTTKFWRETAERAIKTAAQFAVPVWGATTFTVVGEVVPTAGATALAALTGGVLSVLTSLASLKIGPSDSPSVVE